MRVSATSRSEKKRPQPGPRESPAAAGAVDGRGHNLEPYKWKKGQCGNPGGIPRTATQVQLLAREYSPAAVEKIYALMIAPKTKPRDALYAAMLILSWGIGQPKQEVRLKVDDEAAASQRPEVQDPKQRMREIAQALREAGLLDRSRDAEMVEVGAGR